MADTSWMARFGARLVTNGYAILPIGPGTKKPGRFQRGGWTDYPEWNRHAERPTTEVEVATWATWPDCGIGIVGGAVAAVDIDIAADAELALQIEALARARLGDTPALRIGRAPKRMLVYRTAAPFRGIKRHPLEVLCLGQQFLAYADHPDTEAPYVWPDEGLADLDISDLPEITAEAATAFLEEAYAILPEALRQRGLRSAAPATLLRNHGQIGTLPAIRSALDWLPNDELDYDSWMRIGMALKTFAAATLVARMEDAALDHAPVWDDVASFDGRPWRGSVDIVTAGYPCQPFSVVGKRRGADDPRHLWPHVARIIGEVEPPFVFLENVAHHLRLGFPEVASGLVGMGYRLAAGLFTAAEVGAPHKRERLFILAIREGDELADPARLLWHPLEWREPDGIAAPVADAEGQRQREPADEADALAGSGPARDESGDDGCNVADAADRQLSEPGWRQARREGSRRHGAGLADANGNGRKQAERRQPPDGRSDPRQSDVDDADGAGSQGRGDDTGQHAGERAAWPPGPGDADGWAEYLRSAPNLEPAVRRGVDGLAHRVDRLRLCGNGVVPLVAAHALRTLAAELLADG